MNKNRYVQLTCPGCGTTKQVERHELYPEEGVRDWITVSWSYHTVYVCSMACLAQWSGQQQQVEGQPASSLSSI